MELKELEAKILYDPTPRNIQNIFNKLIAQTVNDPEDEFLIIKGFLNLTMNLLSKDVVFKALLGYPEWEEWRKKYKHLIFPKHEIDALKTIENTLKTIEIKKFDNFNNNN